MAASGTVHQEAENPDDYSGVFFRSCGTCTYIGGCDHGNWVRYNGLDLNGAAVFAANIARDGSGYKGDIEIRIDDIAGTLIGKLETQGTGGWETFEVQSTSLTAVSGIHDLYLVFANNWGVANVDWFELEGSGAPKEYSLQEAGHFTDEAAYNLFYNDDNLIIKNANSLVKLDITDPAAPAVVGSYPAENLDDIDVNGDYAYLLRAGSFGGDHFLEKVDISSLPMSRVCINGQLGFWAYQFTAMGDYGYYLTASPDYRLSVRDAADCQFPELGYVVESGYDTPVAVEPDNSYVYLAETSLRVVNVQNKANPFHEAMDIMLGADAQDIHLDGNYLYIAGGSDGLVIVDVADKQAPVVIGSVATYGDALAVYASGDLLYVAMGTDGVALYEVSDKTNPVLQDEFEPPMDAREVIAGTAGYVYVADGSNGLYILQVVADGGPSPDPVEYKFDFGTTSSNVEEGYTRISGQSVYDPAVGYGWDTQKEQTCRHPYLNKDADPYPFYVPLLRDFNVVEGPDDDVFSVDVPSGTYTVTITSGDLCFPHFLDAVKAEGEVKLTNLSMETAEFIESSFTVDVADGQLNIRFIENDGESPINAIVIQN